MILYGNEMVTYDSASKPAVCLDADRGPCAAHGCRLALPVRALSQFLYLSARRSLLYTALYTVSLFPQFMATHTSLAMA